MSDFVDRVTVHVKGGDGGNGSAGIRRRNDDPVAGVSGGDGGEGAAGRFRKNTSRWRDRTVATVVMAVP